MVRSRKYQFVISLTIACICIIAVGVEPDKAKTELIFEINNEKTQSWIASSDGRGAVGPIKPTHVAVFHVRRPWHHLPEGHRDILQILETSAGQSLSEKQRHFLAASDAVVRYGIENIQNHDKVLLYAVSEVEARKVVQAYLEVATKEANSRMKEEKIALQEYEEIIVKAKQELPGRKAELEAIIVEYEIVKKKTHNLSSDTDAAKESKETILQMNKVLDSLAIEITGIEAKLSAVERIKSQRQVSSIEGLAKLEEIKSEQTVELAGALARKKAALSIREREEKFYRLYSQKDRLLIVVNNLQRSLMKSEQNRQRIEEELANPEAWLLPPKLYQNKVTIYPVRTE